MACFSFTMVSAVKIGAATALRACRKANRVPGDPLDMIRLPINPEAVNTGNEIYCATGRVFGIPT